MIRKTNRMKNSSEEGSQGLERKVWPNITGYRDEGQPEAEEGDEEPLF